MNDLFDEIVFNDMQLDNPQEEEIYYNEWAFDQFLIAQGPDPTEELKMLWHNYIDYELPADNFYEEMLAESDYNTGNEW